jgi:hypothetical protein
MLVEKAAVERLLARLSALRQTLEDDERVILDKIVTFAQDPAALHAMTGESAIPTEPKVIEGKIAGEGVIPDGAVHDEVSLHAMPEGDAPQSKMVDWEWGAGKVAPKIAVTDDGNYALAE